MTDGTATTRILLIRHGETRWNGEKRYQGHGRIGLSAKGQSQARLVAGRLAGRAVDARNSMDASDSMDARNSIDALYSSDLPRALETAEIIAKAFPRPLEVRTDAGLREMNFGAWEGLTFDEIQKRYQELARTWLADPAQVRPPGGEAYAEVETRAVTALQTIAANHVGETVAVVTHGGPLRALIRHYLDSPPEAAWRFELSTGGISQVNFLWGGGVSRWDEFVEKHEVVVINDVAHLSAF
ncbi:MAG: histidine phosphatase family protein [Firmicutes bacterium]|nr:histidine phosphatase family protein [Bacillota bacterium]